MLNLYVSLIYLIAAIPYSWLGLYAWRKRPAVAVTPFAWSMLAVSVWTFSYSLELFFPTVPIKLFFVKLEYLGIVSIPIYLMLFALELTGKSQLLTPRMKLLLWGIPILALILVWTNEFHHLMWDMETIIETRGLRLLGLRYGVFFWIHSIFSYVIMAFTIGLLVIELLQRPRIYRLQISLVALGILIPLVGNAIFLIGTNPIKNLDITPLFFLPTALILSWGIVKYRLFEVLPPEHLSVLESMKDGVVVLNPQQKIVYLNPIAETLFNCAENDALGHTLSQVSEQYAERISPHLSGGEERAEIKVGQGGQVKVYELTISPVSILNRAQSQTSFDSIVILHEITERKRMELALARRQSIMSAISLAADQFLKESDWEHNVSGVLEKIGRAANVSRIFVVTNSLDEEDVVFSSLSYEWAEAGIPPQISNPALQHMPLQRSGFERWEELLSRGLPVFGNVVDFPKEEQLFLQSLGSSSVAVMPIFVDSQWWGFIMFDECSRERDWTSIELEAFHIAANIFGSAEARGRSEQKLIQRQNTLNLLHEIVTISLQADNINDMAQTVVNRLGELINADGCFLTLWDEAAKRAIPLAAYGPYRDAYTSLEPQPGERTFTESALALGRTLIIEDSRTTPYADPRIIQRFTSISLLVLPLKVMDKNLGSVLLSFDSPHRFPPEEVSISEQASALIALALEKFQAVEEAQKRAVTSETLRKAGAAVAEKLEMDQTVTHILDQLNKVVPYDSASVQLLIDNELEIIGGRGFADPKSILGIRFSIPGDNPNTVVMESGEPYSIPEIDEKYFMFNDITSIHIRSWLGVPLKAQGILIGLLAIDSTESNHFTEEDINIASKFANQVAVALENARLFEETQAQAITDPLTGVYNRRGLFGLGKVEFARSVRSNQPFSAIMVDLDHFKKINDAYGHAIGDLVLCETANRSKNCIREIDYLGRYGGEELVILLPDTTLSASMMVAERLRMAIANTPVKINEETKINITASLGVAGKDENTTSLEMLISHADQAMYAAKRKGRNRVVASP
ncbi:MAG: diguanylate cyclase [Anaerolineales bacterium]|nr:diguanylate cyclase [Anaerolineales bacterium]